MTALDNDKLMELVAELSAITGDAWSIDIAGTVVTVIENDAPWEGSIAIRRDGDKLHIWGQYDRKGIDHQWLDIPPVYSINVSAAKSAAAIAAEINRRLLKDYVDAAAKYVVHRDSFIVNFNNAIDFLGEENVDSWDAKRPTRLIKSYHSRDKDSAVSHRITSSVWGEYPVTYDFELYALTQEQAGKLREFLKTLTA